MGIKGSAPPTASEEPPVGSGMVPYKAKSGGREHHLPESPPSPQLKILHCRSKQFYVLRIELSTNLVFSSF